jgi:hypothetical protein
MPANNYQFLTEWQVDAPLEQIYITLKEGEYYSKWWPDVYLNASYQPSGCADGVGDRTTFLARGWLPFTCAPWRIYINWRTNT